MSFCDLDKSDADEIPVSKLIFISAKAQAIFFNNVLEGLDINNSQLHILFEVGKDSRINQEKIASRCNIDKGAIARSIKKMEDKGLVKRTIDENNRRQNIISLTKKGSETLNRAMEIFDGYEDYLFDDDDEKNNLKIMLKNLAIKIMALNEEG